MRSASSGGRCERLLNPIPPGIEEEEENHRNDHDVHVEKDHHRAVVETPSRAQAAQRVPGAEECDDGGHKQFERWRIIGPMRQNQGCEQTADHKHGAAQERAMANVKGTGQHYEGNYEYSI